MPELLPQGRLVALNSLSHHPGWEIFCARHKQVMLEGIDRKIFDSTTPAAEREMLVRAREHLVENHTPEKVLNGLIVSTDSEVRQAEQKRSRAQA